MPTGVFAILDKNMNIATINRTTHDILGTETDFGDHFIEKFNRIHGNRIIGLSNVTKELMMKYTWPGNVRELD